MPVLWPVAHVTTALTKPKDDKAGPNVSLGKLDLVGHLTAFCAALRSFSLAYVAIYWLYDGYDYPAFGGGNVEPDNTVKPRNSGNPVIVDKFWPRTLI